MGNRGSQSSYSDELAQYICDRISEGDSLLDICKGEIVKVAPSTVCLWLTQHKSFAEQYTRAREIQGDLMDKLILEAAMAKPERLGMTGGVDTGDVQHRRLKIDALKWRAAHLRPKVYGVKQEIEHSGKLTMEQAIEQAAATKPAQDHA